MFENVGNPYKVNIPKKTWFSKCRNVNNPGFQNAEMSIIQVFKISGFPKGRKMPNLTSLFNISSALPISVLFLSFVSFLPLLSSLYRGLFFYSIVITYWISPPCPPPSPPPEGPLIIWY